MNTRLQQIVAYKTGGRQTEFASLLGWSPQYLAKLLKGDGLGIRPVITIIEKFPDIDARWLLTGEGEMLTDEARAELHRRTADTISTLIDLERYMPVMDPDELRDMEKAIITRTLPSTSPDKLSKWQERLLARQKEMDAKFALLKPHTRKPQ